MKAAEPLRRALLHVQRGDAGATRAARAVVDHVANVLGASFQHDLDRAVAAVGGDPSHTAPLRLPAHAVAKEHALHVPADGHLARDDLLIHVEVPAA